MTNCLPEQELYQLKIARQNTSWTRISWKRVYPGIKRQTMEKIEYTNKVLEYLLDTCHKLNEIYDKYQINVLVKLDP